MITELNREDFIDNARLADLLSRVYFASTHVGKHWVSVLSLTASTNNPAMQHLIRMTRDFEYQLLPNPPEFGYFMPTVDALLEVVGRRKDVRTSQLLVLYLKALLDHSHVQEFIHGTREEFRSEVMRKLIGSGHLRNAAIQTRRSLAIVGLPTTSRFLSTIMRIQEFADTVGLAECVISKRKRFLGCNPGSCLRLIP